MILIFAKLFFAAGIVGAALHYGVTPKLKRESFNKTPFVTELNLVQGFVIEFVLAILLIFSFFLVHFDLRCKSCTGPTQGAPWKIGLIYTLCVIIDVSETFYLYNKFKLLVLRFLFNLSRAGRHNYLG